jgi:hypothetical protein
MFAVRRWSVRNAGVLDTLYRLFDPLLRRLDPLWRRLGYGRLERPIAVLERGVKGFLFDCRMCGQCMLSASGMACPMNCPKGLRNGPCGGVRADGTCELAPEMPCVWVEAWAGNQQLKVPETIMAVQAPVDHRLAGSSSWLRVAREGRDR